MEFAHTYSSGGGRAAAWHSREGMLRFFYFSLCPTKQSKTTLSASSLKKIKNSAGGRRRFLLEHLSTHSQFMLGPALLVTPGPQKKKRALKEP
jgi:hypothetical protein